MLWMLLKNGIMSPKSSAFPWKNIINLLVFFWDLRKMQGIELSILTDSEYPLKFSIRMHL